MVKPNTSMKIHKVKSEEDKEEQQWCMVDDCRYYWRRLNDTKFSDYTDIMNMKTYRINKEHDCWIALTYHLNLNKW